MKTSTTRLAVLLLLTLGLLASAHAQITPIGDAYTNTADPTTNYGSKTLLDVESASQTSYIQFDLSAIPAGYTSADITKASLKLYVSAVTKAGSFNVDYVNGTWSESTITVSNAPALGSTIAASVPLTTADKNQYILIDITPALQAWLSGSQPNDGIALVANSPLNASFDSKENTTTSHSSELDIVFAGGGTITGVTTASGSGLTGGGTSGTLNLALTNACAANQVLQWNGSSWVCAAAASGTITGVTAGTDLTGGGTSGNVTLSLNTAATNSLYAQLAAANTFTGNQTVNGNLNATGVVSGSAFQIGTVLFGYGSYTNQNAFLGFAGNTAMTGQANDALGFKALYSNTTGSANTAIGQYALYANTTGVYNAASGYGALTSNTTGNENAAVGVNALTSNTTGTGNTASGPFSLFTNTTGGPNTALGFQADVGSGNLSNATAIGANAQVTASNTLVLGSIAGVNHASASANIGIGTTAPAATLDVHGTGNFTGLITFAPGQTFPGTGTITGVAAGTGLTGGGGNGNVTLTVDTTKVMTGVVAGTDLTGGGTGGVQTLSLDTSKVPQLAASNSFTGNQTVNGNLSATGVVAASAYQIGSNLFAFGSVATQNTFFGFAGNTILTGLDNTASGGQALPFDTTGSYNTAYGGGALYNNTTGYNNTACGVVALQFNTTGSANTACGSGSGYAHDGSNITGNNNTFLGEEVAMSTGSLNNATALGAQAEVSESNALVLGSINGVNDASASVNVGIGTTAPATTLHVVSGSTYQPVLIQTNSTFGTWLELGNTSSGGHTWNILSAGGGNGEGAGNLAVTDLTGKSTIYLEGNVNVSGNLSKGGGSFQIDHPLDPANKYLYHSFVESPDMKNIYDGNVVTDKRGVATVVLPDYFEALNRDFRYQLTVMGQFAQAIVAKKIGHNRFVIRTSKPNVEVSWQVTGVRHDAYADAHRIQVEVEKPSEEQGRYLHPELFGAPAEQAIGYLALPAPKKPATESETAQASSLKAPPAPLK